MMGKPKILFWILIWSMPALCMNAFAYQENKDESVRMPAPVEDLVYMRPFALSKGYRWSSIPNEPETDRGVSVVLRGDPKLVVPRNSPSPILYAGDRMVQALNFGHKSGNVIGIISGEVNLSETLIWFGSPTAPDLVSAQYIHAQRALAKKAGIRPFPAKTTERVTKAPVEAPDLDSLLRGELADLVLKYAPEESDLARKWRLPEAKAKPANTNAQEVTGEEAGTLPAPVDDLVYARRFTLKKGYRWSWRADEPATEVGVIVVLRVDPELVVPRNSPSPILYAGDRMVQALNFGHKSGNVIGIISGEVNLSETLIWFGSPTAPDLVSAQYIHAQRALAKKAGIRPFPAKTTERVTKAPVEAPDLDSLLRGELADLVLKYAPEESDLARKWRLPEAKAKPDSSRPEVLKP